MAYQDSYGKQHAVRSTDSTDINAWAVGVAFLASMLMMLMGSFHIITGLAAVLDDTFFVVRPNFSLELDVSTWGWINIVTGCVIIAAGMGLLTGAKLARILTIVIAAFAVIWNFYSIPYYPVWSILTTVFAIAVIWALAAHGSDLEKLDE